MLIYIDLRWSYTNNIRRVAGLNLSVTLFIQFSIFIFKMHFQITFLLFLYLFSTIEDCFYHDAQNIACLSTIGISFIRSLFRHDQVDAQETFERKNGLLLC